MAEKVRRGRGEGKMGRPIELTDELLQRIADSVAEGNYVETAADLEGVSVSALRKLMRSGAREIRRLSLDGGEPDPLLVRAVNFSKAIRKARAQSESDDLAAIRKAGATQWQAHAWRLERREPDRWGRRERHEHTGPSGGAIPIGIAVEFVEPSRGGDDNGVRTEEAQEAEEVDPFKSDTE